MPTITTQSRVGRDGVLKLELTTDLADVDCQVTVTVQPLTRSRPARSPQEPGWPPGFFEATAGAWKGEPIIREGQGEYEVREPLR